MNYEKQKKHFYVIEKKYHEKIKTTIWKLEINRDTDIYKEINRDKINIYKEINRDKDMDKENYKEIIRDRDNQR